MGIKQFTKFMKLMGVEPEEIVVSATTVLSIDMNYLAYASLPESLRTGDPSAQLGVLRARLSKFEGVQKRLCWDNPIRDVDKEVRTYSTSSGGRIDTKPLIEGLDEYDHLISANEGEAAASQGGGIVLSSDSDCIMYGAEFFGSGTGYGNRMKGFSYESIRHAFSAGYMRNYQYIINGEPRTFDRSVMQRILILLGTDWSNPVLTPLRLKSVLDSIDSINGYFKNFEREGILKDTLTRFETKVSVQTIESVYIAKRLAERAKRISDDAKYAPESGTVSDTAKTVEPMYDPWFVSPL
jgi:hypothetical protein